MKTVLIYDQLLEAPVKFAVLDGDYSHLNNVYVNSTSSSEDLQDELTGLVYDSAFKERGIFTADFPIQAVKDGAIVIVAGFLP